MNGVVRRTMAVIAIMVIMTLTIVACGKNEKDVNTVEPQPELGLTEVLVDEDSEMEDQEIDPIEEQASALIDEGINSTYGLNGSDINYEHALECFNEAAEIGYNDANYYIGVMYDWVGYPESDVDKAYDYYMMCEDNPLSQLSIAFLYQNGKGVEKDETKADEYAQMALDSGCVEANFYFAKKAYDEGEYDIAYKEYMHVIDDGEDNTFITRCMEYIGIMYLEGKGVAIDRNTALEWYEKAIELGYMGAANALGYHYMDGDINGIPEYDKAVESFEKAISVGITNAFVNLGHCYREGLGVEQDSNKAIELYTRATELGSTSAFVAIGYMYEYGKGVEQSVDIAEEYYQKAGDMGYGVGYSNLGNVYKRKHDYEKAIEYFEKAAELGTSNALNYAGNLYYSGDTGLPKNYDKAMEYYLRGVEMENTTSMMNIAHMYFEGAGVEKNVGTGVEWMEKAVDLEDIDAITNLGTYYDFGTYVEQDFVKARELYEKGASFGSDVCMGNIGYMYETARGVPMDYDKALEWYVMSADFGNIYSMNHIGMMYANGMIGDGPDYVKALEWYDKSAKLGNEDAAKSASNIRVAHPEL